MTETSILVLAIFLAPAIIAIASGRGPHIIACLVLTVLAVMSIGSLDLGGVLLAIVIWLAALIVGFVALSSKSRIAREKAMLAELRRANDIAERRS